MPGKVCAAIAAIGALLTASGCVGVAAAPAQESPAVAAQEPQAPKRPNILLILVDDLRPDIGAYGHPTAQTPNMDVLARSGMVFERAYTQQAVCAPSRAALMTGLRPETTGITTLEQPLDKTVPNAVTMLDLFKANGYDTFGFGKVYHHRDDDRDGWTKYVPSAEYAIRRQRRGEGRQDVAEGRAQDRNALGDTVNARAAIAELERRRASGRPFLMAVGVHKPHLPFIAPTEDFSRYTAATVPAPINPQGQQGAPPWAIVSYEIWNRADTPKQAPMPEAKAKSLQLAYLAAVSYADSIVGELLAALREKGLEDDTIVVLWGDHGFKLGDHGHWAKHSNAEIDTRIPLMLRVPGVTKPGSRTRALVETVDIYPTLAELTGLGSPNAVEGLSMRKLIENPGQPWKQAAFAQYDRSGRNDGAGPLKGRTVRTDRYRYTAWLSQKDGRLVAQELYDHQKDPAESTNVAKDAAYAAALKEAEAIRQAGWGKVRAGVRR